ncbi:hypothetical protein RVM27_04495 [Halomonas sp. KM007]|jgi:hypothetical protein
MLDRFTMPLTHPPLRWVARALHACHITPDQVTLAAFLIGMLALPLLAFEHYGWALLAIVLNRIGDGKAYADMATLSAAQHAESSSAANQAMKATSSVSVAVA